MAYGSTFEASAVGDLRTVIGGLGAEPIESFTNSDLADSLVELEAAISALEAERSRRLTLFSDRGAHHESEHPSASAFLIDRCRIAPQRARRLVAQASALRGMPLTLRGWVRGDLATDQVRHLLSAHAAHPVVFAEHEETLTEAVAGLSVVATGRAVAYWRQAVDHREVDTTQLFEQRRLHLSQTFQGMWRIDGFLDPVGGEILHTALQAAMAPPSSGDTRSGAQRRADALSDLARHVLDHGDLAESGGEKPHLMVLVGAERLHRSHPGNNDGSQSGTVGLAESVTGTVYSQSTLELLACDCSVSRFVFGARSEVIDLGRKTRVIPPALRRAVIARDRHCQHPGCFRPARWCDVDHIVSWLEGGETKLDNLQLLCRYHHRLKHLRQNTRQPNPPHPAPSPNDARNQVLIQMRR
ncbi:MAG TPA: DUF222 domain-containing protein [Acidimicrobiia bacterium]|nr:DUF222 domain-containing protein [Acidimicrobiia bacterium]